jgi:hypothetical protein
MRTQGKLFKECKEHDMFRYGSKLYYKIPVVYYIDSENQAGMYNAVNAETGEIGWVDIYKKVEVIAQWKRKFLKFVMLPHRKCSTVRTLIALITSSNTIT